MSNQITWNNQVIRVNKSSVFFFSLVGKKSALKISCLFNKESNTLMPFKTFMQKYNVQSNFLHYYMASSVRGQDESNPALWLATRAGKMELSCPLGTTRRVPQGKFPRKPYNKSFIDQACLVKIAGYWPHSFFASLWTSTRHLDLTLGQWPIHCTYYNLLSAIPHKWRTMLK